jgi:putative endonuclease
VSRVSAEGYFVYILANRSQRVYVGVTGDLQRRLTQHRTDTGPHFTRRYDVDRLVYVERFLDVRDAISREKQIKGWVRRKKLQLIAYANPKWADLAASWLEGPTG